MRCWCGYLSGVRCRLVAYGPADATAISKPGNLLPHLNLDRFYLFGTGLLRFQILEKRPLNGYSSSSICTLNSNKPTSEYIDSF